jgi:hypothetical protein
MASEIHRRRTGRGLKVTEEIVIKEEMYEEEEDDLPRQFRHLTRHLQTNSSSMNHRMNAYITTQAAMATMARYNEINKLFSESFPAAATYQQQPQQQLNQSMYMAPLTVDAQVSPTSPTMHSPSTQTDAGSVQSQFGSLDRRVSAVSSTPNISNSSTSSPPALSPASGSVETPESRATPYQTPVQAFPSLDPQIQDNSTSPFTSELPNEVKFLGMANVDPTDPMATYFYGGNLSAYQMFGQHPAQASEASAVPQKPVPMAQLPSELQSPLESIEQHDEVLFSPLDAFNSHFESFSRMGTPGAGMTDGAWDSMIDFGTEQ